MIAAFIYSPSPLLIALVGLLVLPQLKAAWRYDPKVPENLAYYGIKTEDRIYYASFYLVLTGFLCPDLLRPAPVVESLSTQVKDRSRLPCAHSRTGRPSKQFRKTRSRK